MSVKIRFLKHVMMSGNEVRINLLSFAEFQKFSQPTNIINTANGGTTDFESVIQFFYCFKCFLEKFEILFHIGALPKSRKVWLVPNFNGPGQHFCFPIAFHQMLQGSLYQSLPICIFGRGRNISFPIEYGLISGSHLRGHKTQFQKRLNGLFFIVIHYHIQIGEIVLHLHIALRILVFLIDSHIIRKKAMPPDMFKPYFCLVHCKLLLISLLQCQSHTTCTYTEIHLIVEKLATVFVYLIGYFFLFHPVPP